MGDRERGVMGALSKIEWTHHTFNPWWGCVKVSEGCKNCYAEAFAKRTGNKVWGPGSERRLFGDKHWAEPLKWNAAAEKAGKRHRVFCASMADVFEDHPDVKDQRARLWTLIEKTPHLDWLLLTKRPQNIPSLLSESFGTREPELPENVWLGCTVENNDEARNRIPDLLEVPAAVHFVSAEPLLEMPDWVPTDIDWVIWGGESGRRARPCAIEWLEVGVEACRMTGAHPFVKQLGSVVVSENRVDANGSWAWRAGLRDSKGGDWNEWPDHLRVREFPR